MQRSASSWFAVLSALVLAAPCALGRPRYGGTLRVQLRAAVKSLDPAERTADPAETALKERLLQLAGPFRVAQFEPGRRVVLEANDACPGGRPFLDSIVIEMGRAPHELLPALELGAADLVEIAPNEVRRAAQSGARIWSPAPRWLLALVFERGRPAAEDARLREALALAIDRPAIHRVLLQKQGEPAGALLPQWLSGWAALFPAARDLVRARHLVEGQPLVPLALEASGPDPLARAIADRVAVNARDAGIRIQVAPPGRGQADLRLVRRRIASLDPARALAGLQLSDAAAASLEAAFALERSLIEEHRVIPLFHLPDLHAASPRLRTWLGPAVLPSGEWRLEDVWLEADKQ